MIPEQYLKYLALKPIADKDDCIIYFANGTYTRIDIDKLKEDVAKLQRDFLDDYICKW